jgi:outer membrane protein assembly factor BamB
MSQPLPCPRPFSGVARAAFFSLAVVLLGGGQSLAAEPADPSAARLIASPEPDWPQFRGPRRDEICDETGLLQSWPEGGPRLLWKSDGLGRGYSAPIVVQDRIYLAGDFGDELRILALDLQGRKVWESQNGRSWEGPYPGARASCTYSEGRLYHMNAHGRVVGLDAATGRELWACLLFERFGGKNLTWATSENLLVDGPRLIVTPGGSRALMAALDKTCGATVWSTEPLRLGPSSGEAQQRLPEPPGGIDSCSYGSPILVALGNRRLIVHTSLRHLFGVDADSGQLLWTRPYPTRYSVIAATPVLVDDAVFITAPDTEEGGKLFRLQFQGAEVRLDLLWSTPLDTCHGGVIYRDGLLYGSWYRRGKGWAAIDARTGAVRYRTDAIDSGSVLYADGRLYCLSQTGEMALLKPGPDRFEVAGRFRLVSERVSDAWTHPVIVHGRLYLRYHDTLFCYGVRAPGSSSAGD